MKFKDLKKNSKESLKKNYVITTLVALVGLTFLSLYGSTNNSLIYFFESIQNYSEKGRFATNLIIDYWDSGLYKEAGTLDYNRLYSLTDDELKEEGYNQSAINYIRSLDPNYEDKTDLVKRLQVRDGFSKPILAFLSSDYNVIFKSAETLSILSIAQNPNSRLKIEAILAIIFAIIYKFFYANILSVGYARFFLENSKYHKTRIERLYYSFTKKYFKTFKAMGLKSIYQSLWDITIIGGIIKSYSYKLVPYIIAEDSNVSARQAIKLSKKLMKGYKWKAFILDISFWGWELLSSFSWGLLGVFFIDAYKEGTYAEFYKELINERLEDDFYKEYLNGREHVDPDLYIKKEKDYYPGTEPNNFEHVLQNYSKMSLVTLFFFFAFIGWFLEITLFLLKTHTFVNRGTLYGPWLPIYGFGCVLILIIFTKTRFKKYVKSPIYMFLLIMVLCGALEYFSSWFLEVTTGLKYWDYAGHFLNINGRICLENLCEFGIGGILCMYIFAPRLNTIIEKANQKNLAKLMVFLLLLFIADNVYSRLVPRTGYGITDAIIDEEGNVITKNNNPL